MMIECPAFGPGDAYARCKHRAILEQVVITVTGYGVGEKVHRLYVTGKRTVELVLQLIR